MALNTVQNFSASGSDFVTGRMRVPGIVIVRYRSNIMTFSLSNHLG